MWTARQEKALELRGERFRLLWEGGEFERLKVLSEEFQVCCQLLRLVMIGFGISVKLLGSDEARIRTVSIFLVSLEDVQCGRRD